MTAQENLSQALGRIDTAHRAVDSATAECQAARELASALRRKEAEAKSSATEHEHLAQREALGNKPVTALADARRYAEEHEFFLKARLKHEAFSLAPLAERLASAQLDELRAVLEGEQARLAVHEQAVAQALVALVRITGNPGLTIGGGERESSGRGNGDLVGARHRELIAEALGAVEQGKVALGNAQAHTAREQRAYQERYPND